jgi:cytosine deaminase
VLPSTDLFLMGRDRDHMIPRGIAPAHRLVAAGVNCSISTNNVLNPFTPYGDCSLIRMANLYANAAQIGDPASLSLCLEMISSRAARLLNHADYGLAPGNPADLVVFDAADPASVIAELAPPLMGFKNGRRSFTREPVRLHGPGASP